MKTTKEYTKFAEETLYNEYDYGVEPFETDVVEELLDIPIAVGKEEAEMLEWAKSIIKQKEGEWFGDGYTAGCYFVEEEPNDFGYKPIQKIVGATRTIYGNVIKVIYKNIGEIDEDKYWNDVEKIAKEENISEEEADEILYGSWDFDDEYMIYGEKELVINIKYDGLTYRYIEDLPFQDEYNYRDMFISYEDLEPELEFLETEL